MTQWVFFITVSACDTYSRIPPAIGFKIIGKYGQLQLLSRKFQHMFVIYLDDQRF